MENKCNFYDGICKSPINKSDLECSLIPIERCYYKQLQQLKQENEKLCTAIRNELPEQYDKRVSEAESDIEWGVLDRNATETEFCKNVIYETRNYIAKLKQENDELKNKLKEVQKFLERYEVGECCWKDDCYWCKGEEKDGKYYCSIGNALEVIRGGECT